jgi:hypothetical protein
MQYQEHVSGMTVQQLIEELQEHDPQAVVVFGCDYGDISHTEQALPVNQVEAIDKEQGELITETAYSRSGQAISKFNEGDCECDADTEKVAEWSEAVIDQMNVVILR